MATTKKKAETPAKKPATAKPATKATAKTTSKPVTKATPKPSARATVKTTAKPAAKATDKAAPKPAAKAAPKPTPKTTAKPTAKAEKKPTEAPSATPAAKTPTKAPKTTKATKDTSKVKKPARESLTAEERERVKKLRTALALLKEDREWPAFLEQQRLALLAMRDSVAPNMQNVTRDHLRSGESNVTSSSGQHIGDAGSEAEVRDLTLRLLDKDREQLFEIDAALERIRKGVYGICEISLELIPKKRLQVRPFCRLTVKCQEEYEKKYGSYSAYRARQSDQVGYANLQNDMKNAISLDEGDE